MRASTKATYSRRDGDIELEVFDELKDILNGYNIQSVSDVSGVAVCTLYFWLDGTTRKPRLDTVIKVATALGYELRMVLIGRATAHKTHLRLVK